MTCFGNDLLEVAGIPKNIGHGAELLLLDIHATGHTHAVVNLLYFIGNSLCVFIAHDVFIVIVSGAGIVVALIILLIEANFHTSDLVARIGGEAHSETDVSQRERNA